MLVPRGQPTTALQRIRAQSEVDMKRVHAATIAWIAALVPAIVMQDAALAQLGVGTWVRQPGPKATVTMTMTVEACCGDGRRLLYKIGDRGQTMLVESAFDGSDATVLVDGKPSTETMAITRIDAHHTSTVLKVNGKPFGTSKATLSADGNTLTVENSMPGSAAGTPGGTLTEIWIRK